MEKFRKTLGENISAESHIVVTYDMLRHQNYIQF